MSLKQLSSHKLSKGACVPGDTTIVSLCIDSRDRYYYEAVQLEILFVK